MSEGDAESIFVMNLESGNAVVLAVCVTALLLVAAPHGADATFKIGGYCKHLCLKGRGGNLCKCSVVHFAGKRGPEAAEEDAFFGDLTPEGDSDDREEEVAPPAPPRPYKPGLLNDVRKLYAEMRALQELGGGDNKLTE